MWGFRHGSKSLYSSLSHVSAGLQCQVGPWSPPDALTGKQDPACSTTEQPNFDNEIDLLLFLVVTNQFVCIYSCIFILLGFYPHFLVLIKTVSPSNHQLSLYTRLFLLEEKNKGNICITLRWHAVSFDVGFSSRCPVSPALLGILKCCIALSLWLLNTNPPTHTHKSHTSFAKANSISCFRG